MTRNRVFAVLGAVVALLLAQVGLVYSLYRSEERTVNGALDDRLRALGATTAAWLARDTADAGPALAALATENRLEDAYAIDATLHVTAGARTRAGTTINMLRVDHDRLTAAIAGAASVGRGYSLDERPVDVAYIPIAGASGARVLALEAGAEFHAPAARVRTTYAIALALTILAAAVFALGLLWALRSLERARLAYGSAERLAAVGQMAAMVAHEVRNPLGILRGQVELARERLPTDSPPREAERFAEMLAEIDRLNRLTELFLGLARDAPVVRATIDLGEMASRVVEDAKLAHRAAHIELARPPEAIEIDGDADRVRQAAYNVVLNALQLGGAEARVRVEVERIGARARLTVIDDGPGVPAALAGQLFEPFATGRPGGSGLGLAIAHRTAERHGATLVLESTPGDRGARFTFYFPLGGTR